MSRSSSSASPHHAILYSGPDKERARFSNFLKETASWIQKFLSTESQGGQLFTQDLQSRKQFPWQRPFENMLLPKRSDPFTPTSTPAARSFTSESLIDIAATCFFYNWYVVDQYLKRAESFTDSFKDEAKHWSAALEEREDDVADAHDHLVAQTIVAPLHWDESLAVIYSIIHGLLQERKKRTTKKSNNREPQKTPPTQSDGVIVVKGGGEQNFSLHISHLDLEACEYVRRSTSTPWVLERTSGNILTRDIESAQRRLLLTLKEASLFGHLFPFHKFLGWAGAKEDPETLRRKFFSTEEGSSATSTYHSAGHLTDRQRRRYKFAARFARGVGW